MRLLVLSFYYRPDLSAGSFRATALVDALCSLPPADKKIDVVTTLPNRYGTYGPKAAAVEKTEGVEIHRISLPRHTSDMLGQSRAFAHFAWHAYRIIRSRQYDFVFATSSRLMTAALGAFVSRRQRIPLYLDIRDIFVDTIGDVLARPIARPISALFGMIERWAMKRAATINIVSEGFRPYLAFRYPRARLVVFSNGIDDEFVAAARRIDSSRRASQPVRVLYAGNIGEGQGLHAIIPELAVRLHGRVTFRILGDGGRRGELVARVTEAGADNVEFHSPVERKQLIEEYRTADVLFLHLNARTAFEKVLPSKIFEYAAMGKPIWAGVGGFAARFLAAEVSNVAIFSPCDVTAAEMAFKSLNLRDSCRDAFVSNYSRTVITAKLAKDIMECAASRSSN